MTENVTQRDLIMQLVGKVDALIVTVAGLSATMTANTGQLSDHEARLRTIETTRTQARTIGELVKWVVPLVVAVIGGGAAEHFLT